MKKNQRFHWKWSISIPKEIIRIMKLTIFLLLMSVVSIFASNSYSQKETLSLNETNRISVSTNSDLLKSGAELKTQPKIVTGRISDVDGQALPGVTIIVKGTTIGTVSDGTGQYSIEGVSANAILVFSFVGMKSTELLVGDQTIINVVLLIDSVGLEEVVAIGYGTQKKATLTGSVSQVSGAELLKSPTINLASSLAGVLPGAITRQSSGEPGRSNPDISIRGMSTTGNNSPLVVVDGVPDVSDWQNINSNDIASISVLKDASAAIYGARAANGVILITTKRGSISAPVISYSFNQGIVRPTMLPKLAKSADLARYFNQMNEETGTPLPFTDAEIQKFEEGSDPNYQSVDWYGEVVKNASTQSQHNLNIRGGSENVKYSVSGSFSNQEGIFKNGSHNFKTYAVRSNMDFKITKHINASIDLNTGLDNGNYPAFGASSILSNLKQVPYLPVFWPDGSPSPGIEHRQNPAVLATDAAGYSSNQTKPFLGKASFNIVIPWVSGLSLDGFYAHTDDKQMLKDWRTPWLVYDYDRATDIYTPIKGGPPNPELTQQFYGSTNDLVNLRVNYQKHFGNNLINVFIAGEQSSGNSYNFSAKRIDFMSSAIDQLFAGSPVNQTANGSETQSGRRNIFGRLNYGYKDKYLIDFNFRYDGSSNFPEGKRYGFFPGVSAAWRISEENFMDQLDFVDNLKLRLSYGKIGNDRISAFQFLNLYSLGGSNAYSFGLPEKLQSALAKGVTPNPDVTWEVLKTGNIGLDGDFLNGLFGFSLDLFQQKRSNILTTKALAVPIFTGLKLPAENIGVVENKGMEIQLKSAKRIGEITYRVSANLAYQKSKVISLSEASNIPEWQRAEGRILGASKVYQAIGIFRTQEEIDASIVFPGTKIGDLQYKDVNGDKQIDALDMVMVDKSIFPRVTGGFQISVEYRNFSLWTNFAGQAGGYLEYFAYGPQGQNTFDYILQNRYTPGSMDSKFPRLPTASAYGAGQVNRLESDYWLMSNSFLRLKTLELGYSLPTAFLSQFHINSFRVYINGNDLFVISKMKLFDPANVQSRGDYYPLMSVYNLGFNLTF